MKKRKITTPYNIVQSNRKVVALRGGAFLFILLFAICFFSSISSSPMKAMTENGVAITNPLFGNDGILKIIMCLYFPVCFTIGPYVLFKGLTNVFTLKSCLAMLLTLVGVIVAFIVIIELFDIKYPQAAVHIIVVVICGLNIPVLVNYARKMNEVATVLGINNTVKNKQ